MIKYPKITNIGFTCHRYDIDIGLLKKLISKVLTGHQYQYINIGDTAMIFSIYQPTSSMQCSQQTKTG